MNQDLRNETLILIQEVRYLLKPYSRDPFLPSSEFLKYHILAEFKKRFFDNCQVKKRSILAALTALKYTALPAVMRYS